MSSPGAPSTTPVNLKYIYRVTDPTHFDSAFVTALGARIAARIASGLYGDAETAKALTEMAEMAIREAKASNAIEGVPWRNDTVYRATMGFLAKSEKVSEWQIALKFRSCYAPTRDDLLRQHPWNFATKRATLVQSSTAPLNEFAYAYILPTDYLDAQAVNDSNMPHPHPHLHAPPIRYVIENGQLLTDLETVILRYTARITDPASFDSAFVTCLGAKIASIVAFGLYGNASLAANLTALAESTLRKATGADVTEAPPQRAPRGRTWADAR